MTVVTTTEKIILHINVCYLGNKKPGEEIKNLFNNV